MKTKSLTVTECCKQNPAHAKLIRAVVKQLGGMNTDTQQMMSDILAHGIDGGFHGFIYYSDTCKFAVKYQKEINALLSEQADNYSKSALDNINTVRMVQGFSVFRRDGMDKDDLKDLYLFLAGHAGRCSGHTVTNVLAWFACEEVCRMFLPEY